MFGRDDGAAGWLAGWDSLGDLEEAWHEGSAGWTDAHREQA